MFDVRNEVNPSTHRKLHADVDEANHVLEGVLGQSAQLVRGCWQYHEDPGPDGPRPAIHLVLKDPFSGQGTEVFDPWELSSLEHLRGRLFRFWGNLLRQSSHESLARLNRLVDDLSGNQAVATDD